MTSEEAVKELKELDGADPDEAHIKADSILIEFLASQGFGAVTDAYNNVKNSIGFWYA